MCGSRRWFPRERGCSDAELPEVGRVDVVPARAGVFRSRLGQWLALARVPTSHLQVEHRPHPPTVLGSFGSARHRTQPGEFRQHPVVRDRMDRLVRQSNDQGLTPLVSEVYGHSAAAARDRRAHQQFRQLRCCPARFSVAPLLQPKQHVARGLLRGPGCGLQLPVRGPPVPHHHPSVNCGREVGIRAPWGNRAPRRRRSLRRMVRGVVRHDGSPGSARTPIVGPGVTARGGDRPILHPYRLALTSAALRWRASGRRSH